LLRINKSFWEAAMRDVSEYSGVVSELMKLYGSEEKKEPAKIEIPNYKKIEDISVYDQEKIRLKAPGKIEKLCFPEPDELSLISAVKSGRKREYRQFLWGFSGKVNEEIIIKQYNDLIKEYAQLRSVYIYDMVDEPMKVVVHRKKETFQILNITNVSAAEQELLIKNFMAAEARKEIDLERDLPIRVQAFFVSRDHIIVLMSVYDYISLPEPPLGMVSKIFKGLSFDKSFVPNIAESEIEKFNNSFGRKCRSYFEKLLRPLPDKVLIPGIKAKNTEGQFTVFYKLDTDISGMLHLCGELQRVKMEAIIMDTWRRLLARFNPGKKGVFLLRHRGERLNYLPVVVDFEAKSLTMAKDIEEQLAASDNFSAIRDSELAEIILKNLVDYFSLVHNFMVFEKKEDWINMKELRKNGEYTVINGKHNDLWVDYYICGDEVGVMYVTSAGVTELAVDRIHKSFEEQLKEALSELCKG